MSVYDLLSAMNTEDKSVPEAVEKVLHRIETVVILITEKTAPAVDYFTWVPAQVVV